MSQHSHIETGLSVLEARLLNPHGGQVRRSVDVHPFVTFGHETAAGARTIVEALRNRLLELKQAGCAESMSPFSIPAGR